MPNTDNKATNFSGTVTSLEQAPRKEVDENLNNVSGSSSNLWDRCRYKCKDCGKLYLKAGSLRDHYKFKHKYHRGGCVAQDLVHRTLFNCPACGISLQWDRATLVQHARNAHKMTPAAYERDILSGNASSMASDADGQGDLLALSQVDGSLMSPQREKEEASLNHAVCAMSLWGLPVPSLNTSGVTMDNSEVISENA